MNNLVQEIKSLGIYPTQMASLSKLSSFPSQPLPSPSRSNAPSTTLITIPSTNPSQMQPSLLITPPNQALKWQVPEVCEWLKKEGMGNLEFSFTKEVVDGRALKELHEMILYHKAEAHAMLKEMGLDWAMFFVSLLLSNRCILNKYIN